jgi:hypothetical protein
MSTCVIQIERREPQVVVKIFSQELFVATQLNGEYMPQSNQVDLPIGPNPPTTKHFY